MQMEEYENHKGTPGLMLGMLGFGSVHPAAFEKSPNPKLDYHGSGFLFRDPSWWT